MTRPVKLTPTFDAAMDRLSRAVAVVSTGFEQQDGALVAQGYIEFDAAVADALATLEPL